MFLLDRFFDGTFFTYGIEVMSFADRDQVQFHFWNALINPPPKKKLETNCTIQFFNLNMIKNER
jgi:hypothetical protein